MRPLLPAAIAAVLTVGIAAAQYKLPPAPQPSQPAQNPGSVQVAPNPNVQMSFPAPDDELATARRIPRDEAIKMVKQGKAVFIDVRSKDSYDLDHIPGAISLPLSELMSRLPELPQHKFLITYCA